MFFLYTCKCDRDFILIEDDFKTIKNPVIQCPYCGSFKVRRTGKYDKVKDEVFKTYKKQDLLLYLVELYKGVNNG